MVIGSYTLIITLNINVLNAPSKTHRPVGWIQKQDLYIYCLQEIHLRPRDTYRLKVRKEYPCRYSTQMEIKRKLEKKDGIR